MWQASTILLLIFHATKAINDFGLVSDSDHHLAPTSRAVNDEGCGFKSFGLKIGDNGTIVTPDYPIGYPPSLRCIWWLRSTTGSKIRVNCSDIHTQSCVPDLYDYALLSPDWTWQSYSIVCGENGSKFPLVMESNYNDFSIFFRSSLLENGRGLKCDYEVFSSATTTTSTTTVAPLKKYNGPDICGKPVLDTTRIVGGEAATPHEFPWLVGLSMNDSWFCGGTLINQKWVLTAAHCLTGATFANILLGAHQLYQFDNKVVTMRSNSLVSHPNYLAAEIRDDIGLIELPRPINFTDAIRPVCLPTRDSIFVDDSGQFMVAAGWGKTSTTGSISEVLNKVTVKVVSNSECKKSFGSNIIHETTMCATGVSKGSGTCQGDSGSSLQYSVERGRWVQVGVVSFGAATGCDNEHPNGYSKIAHYLDWIGNVTGVHYD